MNQNELFGNNFNYGSTSSEVHLPGWKTPLALKIKSARNKTSLASFSISEKCLLDFSAFIHYNLISFRKLAFECQYLIRNDQYSIELQNLTSTLKYVFENIRWCRRASSGVTTVISMYSIREFCFYFCFRWRNQNFQFETKCKGFIVEYCWTQEVLS